MGFGVAAVRMDSCRPPFLEPLPPPMGHQYLQSPCFHQWATSISIASASTNGSAPIHSLGWPRVGLVGQESEWECPVFHSDSWAGQGSEWKWAVLILGLAKDHNGNGLFSILSLDALPRYPLQLNYKYNHTINNEKEIDEARPRTNQAVGAQYRKKCHHKPSVFLLGMISSPIIPPPSLSLKGLQTSHYRGGID